MLTQNVQVLPRRPRVGSDPCSAAWNYGFERRNHGFGFKPKFEIFSFVSLVSFRSLFFNFRFVGFVSVQMLGEISMIPKKYLHPNFFSISFRRFRFGQNFFLFRFSQILFLFCFGGFAETNRNPKPCVFETMVSPNTGGLFKVFGRILGYALRAAHQVSVLCVWGTYCKHWRRQSGRGGGGCCSFE